jgi:outer membrane protein assembly factor BamB
LDAATGKEVWREQYDALGASGPASRFSGPRSSPAVADGKVVTFGVRGTLSCLDAATGNVLWRKNDYPGAWPRFFTSASPIIVEGACIAQVGGPDNGGIVAYDLVTGDQKWKWDGDRPAYASPVLLNAGGTKQIVTLTANNIVGLSAANGQLAWQAPFVPQRRAYNAATPIVDGATVIYIGSGRGAKAVKIVKQGDAYAAQELWSNSDTSVQFNTPVLKDGLLFGLSQDGEFFCINAEDGQTAWTKATGPRRCGKPSVCQGSDFRHAVGDSVISGE